MARDGTVSKRSYLEGGRAFSLALGFGSWIRCLVFFYITCRESSLLSGTVSSCQSLNGGSALSPICSYPLFILILFSHLYIFTLGGLIQSDALKYYVFEISRFVSPALILS